VSLHTECLSYHCHVTIENITAESEHTLQLSLQLKKGMENYIATEDVVLNYYHNYELDLYTSVGFEKITVPLKI
jgi:hypothetical protein